MEVVSFLSQGGMSEVYLGRHPEAGLVVLKRLIPALERRPDVPEMFEEEIRVSRLVSGHPNVVRYIDDGHLDGSRFLALELLDGLTLFELVSRVAAGAIVVPPEVVLGVGIGVLEGLHHAHQVADEEGRPLHIVHRDISPENVVLTWDGVTKIFDFGVARARGRATQTQPGLLKGKPHYMAPEQLRLENLDHRVDLFATGVLLYQLATGKHPFRLQEGRNIMLAILEDAPPPPSSLRPELPKALDDVLLKALSKLPDARFESAEAMQEALLYTNVEAPREEDLAMFASEVRPATPPGQEVPPDLRGRRSWAGDPELDSGARARVDAMVRLYRGPAAPPPERTPVPEPPLPALTPPPLPPAPPMPISAPAVEPVRAGSALRWVTGLTAAVLVASLAIRGGLFSPPMVDVSSVPSGAKVWVNDTPQAQLTPTRVDPGQWAVVHLRLEQPGYAPCLVTVTRPDQGANVRCMMAPEVQP